MLSRWFLTDKIIVKSCSPALLGRSIRRYPLERYSDSRRSLQRRTLNIDNRQSSEVSELPVALIVAEEIDADLKYCNYFYQVLKCSLVYHTTREHGNLREPCVLSILNLEPGRNFQMLMVDLTCPSVCPGSVSRITPMAKLNWNDVF